MGWEAIVAVLMFVAGALFMGRRQKKQAADAAVDAVDVRAEEASHVAKDKFAARVAAAKVAAAASVADRPHTDDPSADLRDRLDR